jgi:hypothetical protein
MFFFFNLYILYEGLGIGKLQFLIKKKIFFSCNFFHFLVIKALDPDWIRIRIRIGLQPQTLDPEKMNTDPKPWFRDTQRSCDAFRFERYLNC